MLSLVWSCNKEEEVMSCTVISQKNTYENCCGLAPIEKDFEPGKIYLPNIFTPRNNDGINDFFIVYADEDIERVEKLIITDTTGLVVYEASEFMPNDVFEAWVPEETLANGYYNVSIKVKNINGDEFEAMGGVCIFACDELNPFEYTMNCGSPSQHNGNGKFDEILPDNEEACQ